ncbi:NUDIX hydrolase [Gorillibacterium massiliense]|uniref:NUDIX hydrolase n=1 Tax=Gorillibacterium massiliense TaxID=1280390 RepID=UPI0004AE0266|nr:NUDIX domain-containing protein [Gorillibacterium massiliense]
MELLAEIGEEVLEVEHLPVSGRYGVRKASRAIVLNSDNEIALLYVAKRDYHKLPGGGVEEGEDALAALHRETAEEAGVKIRVTGEVGAIIEYRARQELLQLSYCYTAMVERFLDGPAFTEKEQLNGFSLIWVPIDEALERMAKDRPQDYTGQFIHKRDLLFLQNAMELIQEQA